MRLLFYAINGVGLGHLNITSIIASEIIKLEPNWEILFITQARFTEILERRNLEFVKLPLSEWMVDIKKRSGKIPHQRYDELTNNIIDLYSPDAIIYDWAIPRKVIHYANSKGIPNILIWRKKNNYQFKELLSPNSIFELFSYVCLPHTKKELASLGVNTRLIKILKSRKVEFIGPLIRSEKIVRQPHKEFNILISAGGGGWYDSGMFLKEAFLACKRMMLKHPDIRLRIITGPYYDGELLNIPHDKRVSVEKFSFDFMNILANSDLVISPAGYNTCNEIIYCKTPAILFPGFRYVENQLERARFLEKKGVAVVSRNPKKIFGILNELYSNKKKLLLMRSNFSKIKLHMGNKKLAKRIISIVGSESIVKSRQYIKIGKNRLVLKNASAISKIKSLSNFKVIQYYSNDNRLADEQFIDNLIKKGVNSFAFDFYEIFPHYHDKLIGKKGNFKNMLKAIAILKKKKIHYLINVFLNKNRSKSLSMMKFALRLGAAHIQFIVPKNVDLISHEIYLRKRFYKSGHYFKYIYFTQVVNSSKSVNIERYYSLLANFFHQKLRVMSHDMQELLKIAGLLDKFKAIDLEISEVEINLIKEFSKLNKIEFEINRLSQRNPRSIKIRQLNSKLELFSKNRIFPLKFKLNELILEKDRLLESKKIFKQFSSLAKRMEFYKNEWRLYSERLHSVL